MSLRYWIFGLALVAAPGTLKAQDIFVDAVEYRCFVDNSERYLAATEQGIAIIILENCPDTEVTSDDIQRLSLNVDVHPRTGEGAPFVSLRQSELSCISGARERFLAAPITSGTVNLTRALREYC